MDSHKSILDIASASRYSISTNNYILKVLDMKSSDSALFDYLFKPVHYRELLVEPDDRIS